MTPLRASDMALPQELKLRGIVNLKAWKCLVESTLKQNKLFDHINPDKHKETPPESESDKKVVVPTADEESNSLVKMMLCVNVDPDFVPIVMEHELAFDGYTSLCRFIEGNTTAALENSLTHFIDLAGNFDTFATPGDYILEHKAMVSRQSQLGFPLPKLVYSLLFIRAASSKYPQWAANQRFHMSVAKDEKAAPTLATLYMTLQDHARLHETTNTSAGPISQSHATGQGQKGQGGNKKKKDKPTCNHCGGKHSSDDCYLEHPEKRAAREKQLGKPVKEIPSLRAEFDKRKASKQAGHSSGSGSGGGVHHVNWSYPSASGYPSSDPGDANYERRLEKWSPHTSRTGPQHVHMATDYHAIAQGFEDLDFQ